MPLSTLILALRKGASVKNPTPYKWAGAAVAVGLVALKAAQAAGYLLEIEDEVVIELVMAGVVLWAHVATTDKIGLLPAARDHSAAGGGAGERLHDQPLPSGADAAEQRESGGFPRGPFFDA